MPAEARPVSIYKLFDPDNGEVRYVGKTVRVPKTRLTAHIYAARSGGRTPLSAWIRDLLDAGREPSIAVVEVLLPGEDWGEREKYWIARGRRGGLNLTNATDGGAGGAGRKHTPEARRRISEARRAARRTI